MGCVTLLLLWSDFIFSVHVGFVKYLPVCFLILSSPLPPLLSPFPPFPSLTSNATQWSSSLAQTTAATVAITAAIDGTPARWWRRRNSGGGGDHTGYGWSDHCFCRATDDQTGDIGEDVSWRGHGRETGGRMEEGAVREE